MHRLPFVLVLLSLLLAGSLAPADAAKRKRTACERLGGRDLAPAPKLKVVKVERDGDVAIRACTLRGGKVRTLASFERESDFDSGEIDVLATTDRYVLLDAYSREKGSGQGLSRVDARNRRTTHITGGTCDPSQFCQGTVSTEHAMHPSGAVAVIVREYTSASVSPAPPDTPLKVELYAVDGTRTVLDTAPGLTGLAFEGDEVVWTRAGQPQRAPVGGA